MKKLKINIPTVLAIALAVTLTTCQSERVKEEAEKNRQKEIIQNSIVTINEALIPAKDSIYNQETGELEELEVAEIPKVKVK